MIFTNREVLLLIMQIMGIAWGTMIFSNIELTSVQKVKVAFLTVVPTIMYVILYSKGDL